MVEHVDPRVTRSRQAVLAAARALLVRDGPGAVTHVRVAQAAGLSRSTVYRHWPTIEALLLEAMSGSPLPFFERPSSPLRAWMLTELHALVDQLALVEVRAVVTTLTNGAQWDSGLAGRRRALVEEISLRIVRAVCLAEDRGELKLRVDARDTPALLIGPPLFRAMLEDTTTSPALLEAGLDTIGTWATPED